MRVFTLLIVVASAIAFAPSASRKSSSSLMMSEKSRSLPFLNKPKNLDGLVVSITSSIEIR